MGKSIKHSKKPNRKHFKKQTKKHFRKKTKKHKGGQKPSARRKASLPHRSIEGILKRRSEMGKLKKQYKRFAKTLSLWPIDEETVERYKMEEEMGTAMVGVTLAARQEVIDFYLLRRLPLPAPEQLKRELKAAVKRALDDLESGTHLDNS